MKLRILGSGTSSGVPRIGNDWGRCDPQEPRNRRTRASALVEDGETRILIDTGPDMREQLLAASVSDIDAIIWTHDHADHCHGIDDIRQIYHVRGVPIPGYARSDTLQLLQSRFGYVFAGRAGYRSIADGRVLPASMMIGSISVHTVDQPHGGITSAGLRFEQDGKSIGYATDFGYVTEEMTAFYQGVDLLLVDALREAPHPTHMSLDEAVTFAGAVGAKRTVLIHMDHTMDYATLTQVLPPGIEPGFDGMELQP